MEKQKGGVAIIILIILLIAGGWYYFISKQDSSQNTSTVLEEVSEAVEDDMPTSKVPTRTTDENNKVDNKETNLYKSQKHGFSIKYPNGWSLYQELDDINRISFGQEKNFNSAGYDGEMFVFVYNQSEQSKEDIISSMGKQFEYSRQENLENITINGLPATKVTVTTSEAPDWFYQAVIVEQGGKVFWIHNGAVERSEFTGFYNSFELI